jgi:hypothetical protein
MADRETKVAETEALYREVNEEIAAAAVRLEADDVDFVCECGDPGCARRVEAPLDEYEPVRRSPTRFLVAPGHEYEPGERVVARRRGYWVVEKVSETMRRVVRRLDPRSRPQPDMT